MNKRLWNRVVFLIVLVALTLLAVGSVAAQPSYYQVISVSPTTAGVTEDGIPYDTYDIVSREGYYNGVAPLPNAVGYTWYKLFDGEAYGLGPKHAISAISIQAENTLGSACGLECVDAIYMSFRQDSIVVPGAGKVLGQDIVVFEPNSIFVNQVDGEFSLVFDGSDVGLTTREEKIDSLDYWPFVSGNAPAINADLGDCLAGYFFIGTAGDYRVPAANGGSLVGDGSDVLIFCATNLGSSTAGFWFRGFDAEDEGVVPADAMNGLDVYAGQETGVAAVEEEDAVLSFYFTARTAFWAGTVAGGPAEVFQFDGVCESGFDEVEDGDLNATYPALNGQPGGFDIGGDEYLICNL